MSLSVSIPPEAYCGVVEVDLVECRWSHDPAQDHLMHRSHAVTRDRSTRSRTLCVTVVAALLFIPACTSGEQTTTGDATPDTAPARSEPANVNATGAPTSEAPDAPSPAVEGSERAAAGGDVADIDLDADYCDIVVQAQESGLFAGEGPQTPDELTAAAEQIRQIGDAMVRQAPDQIADDVRVSTRGVSDALSVLEAHASRTGEVGADAADAPEVQAAMDSLESQEIREANDRVVAWQRENC
jgi:hypothetical protein